MHYQHEKSEALFQTLHFFELGDYFDKGIFFNSDRSWREKFSDDAILQEVYRIFRALFR